VTAARILLVEDDGQVLRSRVGIGPKGSPEESFSLPVGDSFSGQVALTGKPLVVPDTRNDCASPTMSNGRSSSRTWACP